MRIKVYVSLNYSLWLKAWFLVGILLVLALWRLLTYPFETESPRFETQQIQIPESGQESDNALSQKEKKTKKLTITALQKKDLNTSSQDELESIRGIGTTLGARIIEYRKIFGGFKSLEELRQVKGFEKSYDSIAPYLFLTPSVNLPLQLNLKTPVNLNTVEPLAFAQMGIVPQYNATQIMRYREACKGFRNMAHALKTYGLNSEAQKRLQQYCIVRPSPNQMIDINEADSLALERLPAIGKRLASRIIKYRNLLGFYHSVAQLKEVYYLHDTTYQIVAPYLYVTANLDKYPHIDINTIDYEQLAKHPYLKDKRIAKRIINFRRKIKHYQNWDDLRKVYDLDENTLQNLKPYIRF